ncbi:LuxR C-terminal-related transcriptional regulator [Candidatus Neptunichlamydia sp. REUL1]|uniref:LuxR C-terminal-related transcriptional regulator n=1 Tax=Candidatus Neptunichlamydia sp. REUL1 TaxID=3064277 RepID=UPI00292CB82F|nr:LuxR C-terminal-related transcriptional regulator [Candidatus Neptunochlamydia sp. REUL1]
MHELYRSLFTDIKIDLLNLKQQEKQCFSVWNFEATYSGIPEHIKKEDFTSFFSCQYIDLLEKSNINFKKINYFVDVFISYNDKGKLSAYCSTVDMNSIYKNLEIFVKKESYKEECILHCNEQLIIERLKNISNKLTKREIECLSLNLYGFSAKQIAAVFSTSYRTVQSQLGSAINKVECFNKIDCIEKFYESEILDVWNDLAKILMKKYKK